MHHSFDINLASIYGINAAIIIHHFQHWIRVNRKLKSNFKEGRTWSYQTLDEIAAHFPYFTREEVRGAIELLCNGISRRSKKDVQDFEPILLKGNFNKTNFDRTVWYAFVDEERFSNNSYEREISQIESGNLPNPKRRSPTTIPDSKTDAIPDTIVCSEPPVVASHLKDSLSICEKTHPDGRKIKVQLEQVFRHAILQKKDFTLDEMREAWKILVDCKQPVRDPFRFIEGTIKKIRNAKTHLPITKKEQEKCIKAVSQQKNEVTMPKRACLALDTLGRPLVKSS